MKRFRLRVEEPDGQVRDFPLTESEVVVGRASGGGIVVSHPSVSRRHLRLDVGDENVTVEDLGSATGTYIRGRRIEAGTVVHLGTDEELLFGDVRATLVPEVVQVAGEAVGGDSTPLTFDVHIEPPAAPVAAGATATATIRIENHSAEADDFTIRIEEHIGTWIQVTRPHLSLAAGTSDEITVVLRPPRSAEATAGSHRFAVAVTSQRSQREVRSLASYSVERFENATLRLQPTRTRGDFRVVLTNQGNARVRYAVSGEDQDDELEFTFPQEAADVEPGQSTSIKAKVRSRRRRLFGHAQTLRFSVTATAAEGTTADLATAGQVEIRPPLRHWRSLLVAVGGLTAVAAGGVVLFARGGGTKLPSVNSGGATATAPATAAPTSPPATTSTEPSSTATATEEPLGLRKGGTAVVTNSPENDCLLVRADHSRQSAAIAFLCNGAIVTLLSDRVEDDGHYWWKIDAGNGVQGWSAEKAVGSDEIWLAGP